MKSCIYMKKYMSMMDSDVYANPVRLRVTVDADDYDERKKINRLCSKFLQTAALLEPEEILACQVNLGRECEIYAFSGNRSGVTKEDYQWIFGECMNIENLNEEDSEEEDPDGEDLDEENLGEEIRSSYYYMLCQKKPEPEAEEEASFYEEEYEYRRWNADYCRETIEELRRENGTIHILAGPEDNGWGIILIGLKRKMTIRMQSMISMAFSDIEILEVDKTARAEEEAAPGSLCLPPDYITGLWIACVKECRKTDRTSEIPETYENPLDMDELDMDEWDMDRRDTKSSDKNLSEKNSSDMNQSEQNQSGREAGSCKYTAEMTLDELNLSVRAYNSLKRARINTAEELLNMPNEKLKTIRNLGRKCYEEVRELKKYIYIEDMPDAAPSCSYADRLEKLVGLEQVKARMKKLTAYARMEQDMKTRGLAKEPITMNMIFQGNPGTAKTTVARILAGLLNEIGILSSGEMVEVGRADLIANYEGQTSGKVKSVFERAKGKLLFVDEAYSLLEGEGGAFGDEAINTIVLEMENHRDETIVVFAGYPDKMKEFLSRNPGLRSRVPFVIDFADYSPEEMCEIAKLEAEKHAFTICREAEQQIHSICEAVCRCPDSGNGRFCRNLVEDAMLNFALRVYGSEQEKDIRFELTADDIRMPENLQPDRQKRKIGFGQD